MPPPLPATNATSILHFFAKPGTHGGYTEDWNSLIGIVTALVGNVLISFALNTQRYAHLRISREEDRRDRRKAKNGNVRRRGSDASRRHLQEEDLDDNEAQETDALLPSGSHSQSQETKRKRKSYLHSPYWWIGIILMTIGETGNFLAYGFAPASIVSPLGVVALISNCIVAPLVFKEPFRLRDFFGVVVAVGGAVTVVLSASDNNPKLGPHEIWELITRWEFETYLGITIGCILGLMLLSKKYGQKSIFIDLGLVGLFGGYTALSTKGVASLLSYKLWRVLTFPVTYLLVFVLAFTAIMQIKYINRALQRFESTQVIPTQFVMFTLSVILGSAILYRDFEKTRGDDAGKFIGGCAMTFLGVWLITSKRSRRPDEGSAVEGEQTEVGLMQEGYEAQIDGFGSKPSGISSSIGGQIVTEERRPSHFHHDSTTSYPQSPLFPPSTPKITLTPQISNEERPGHRDSPVSTSAALTENPWASTSRDDLLRPSQPKLTTTSSAPILPSEAQLISPNYTHRPSTPRRPSEQTIPHTPSNGNGIGMLTGPLMSPLSASLSAVVADSLRKATLRSQWGNPRNAVRTWGPGQRPPHLPRANSSASRIPEEREDWESESGERRERPRGSSDANLLTSGQIWGDEGGQGLRRKSLGGIVSIMDFFRTTRKEVGGDGEEGARESGYENA